MASKVKCTCGWSWDKSDSSKKDMYICHECGRDNSNNMKNGGWLDNIPQAQNGEDISNLMQEGIDSVQSIYRNYGPPTMFGKLPFNLGAGIGLLQSHVNNEPEKLSDQLGIVPNPYMQAASYTMLMAEKEKENMQEYARKKYKGEDLTELVPEQEVNPKLIDNTYVPKPKVGKLKEIKKQNKAQLTPYKEQREVNKVEIDNTRTNKQRVDTNYKSKPKPETKYKFTTPNISYRDDSFVMPNEVNDIKIDNTYVSTPRLNYNEGLKNGGWLDNYNDSQASAPEGMEGDGFSNVGRNYSPAWGGQFQMGGNVYPVNYVPQAQMGMSMPGAPGNMYARIGAPSKGPKRNQVDVTDASAQNGKEMQYYQNGLDYQPKSISKNGSWLSKYEDGEIVKGDQDGYRNPDNRGKVVEIKGSTMGTDGYKDTLYVVPDVGEPRVVYANTGNHEFPGATKFTEYPMAQNGIRQEQKSLQNLDNLTNFTNYNKPQPGGWLNKYN